MPRGASAIVDRPVRAWWRRATVPWYFSGSVFPDRGFSWRIVQVASVQERVIDIVAEQLGVDKEKVTPETSFVNDLGADSLDTVELVMELEEEFDITIPDDAAEKIQTVGQAVQYIENPAARRLRTRSWFRPRSALEGAIQRFEFRKTCFRPMRSRAGGSTPIHTYELWPLRH